MKFYFFTSILDFESLLSAFNIGGEDDHDHEEGDDHGEEGFDGHGDEDDHDEDGGEDGDEDDHEDENDHENEGSASMPTNRKKRSAEDEEGHDEAKVSWLYHKSQYDFFPSYVQITKVQYT